MADMITICNLALSKIGEPPISDLEEGSREARAVGLIYAACRDEVMQLRPWTSCVTRTSLSPLSDSPSFEYSYAYVLPSDFIDLVRLGESDDDQIAYKIESGMLLTDSETAYIIYIYRNENAGNYEPKLVDLIASRMAVDLALSVASNQSMSESKRQQYELGRQMARSIDGQTIGQPSFTFTSFVDARS